MKTSISTLKVNQKAQKAVDKAEFSIKRFAKFMNRQRSEIGGDIPPESQIQKAANFIKNFKGGGGSKREGPLGGGLFAGAGALLLLPLLLVKGAQATPADQFKMIHQSYGGDPKAVQQDISKAQQTKDKGQESLKKATDDGKAMNKSDIDNIKNIEKDKNADKSVKPPEEEDPNAQDPISDDVEKEALTGTSDTGVLPVRKSDLNRFGELTTRFDKLAKKGSFMEGKPETVGGTIGKGVKRVAAGVLDALTFNLFDFDKKNKKKEESGIKTVEVRWVEDKSSAEPQTDFMGKKKSEVKGSMDTESEDFHKLTAISALEGGDDQARADVAQSVYNRVADGTYGGNISEVLMADGQYQPAYQDPNVSSGPGTKTASEFKKIKDKKSAVTAMVSYYEKRGQEVTRKQMEALYDKTAEALQNPELQQSAAEHVGGRTEFLGGKVEGSDVVDRGGMEDNAFFAEYGSGEQLERGPASNPLRTDLSSVQTQERGEGTMPPAQYASYNDPTSEQEQMPQILMAGALPQSKPAFNVNHPQVKENPPQFIPIGDDAHAVLALMQITSLGAS